MDKNKILDYVMNTPGNTNRAVLSSMLNGLDSGDEVSRVLLYENNALLFDVQGRPPIEYTSTFGEDNGLLLHPTLILADEPIRVTVEIDNAYSITDTFSYTAGTGSNTQIGIGISNPGNGNAIEQGNNIGVLFSAPNLDAMKLSDLNGNVLYKLVFFMVNSNVINTEITHSVKIYKEA